MATQVQDFTPGRRPKVLLPVIDRGSSSITLAATFTATRCIISAEIGEGLSEAELAATAAGDAQIERGDYVTLSELESAGGE
ncbi:MAG: hypothetical protein KGK07_13380 [Chloroflexota bacterium]|nr:hypothetical protein [Chloroflexota bacterium]